MMIATNAPVMQSHHCACEGRFSARMSPVTAALRSRVVFGVFISLHQRNSKTMLNATQSAMTRSA